LAALLDIVVVGLDLDNGKAPPTVKGNGDSDIFRLAPVRTTQGPPRDSLTIGLSFIAIIGTLIDLVAIGTVRCLLSDVDPHHVKCEEDGGRTYCSCSFST
jgi:hypothetical protein